VNIAFNLRHFLLHACWFPTFAPLQQQPTGPASPAAATGGSGAQQRLPHPASARRRAPDPSSTRGRGGGDDDTSHQPYKKRKAI
jgi:hypothetical protein